MAHRISLHGRETAEELSSSPILLHVRAVLRNTSQLLRLRWTRTGQKYLCTMNQKSCYRQTPISSRRTVSSTSIGKISPGQSARCNMQ